MHVVVLGGGYAGLTLTRLLESRLPEDVDLTLIDESPDHLVQHELHRVVRRPALADEITVSLPDAVDRADVRVGRVQSIDRDRRSVSLPGSALSYDVCAICLGTETAFYGLEGVREHATPLKRLAHATRIRRDALEVIEEGGRIVVGGAGLSGVQVAGELAELARDDGTDTEVVLLEQFDAVAPGFPQQFQRVVRHALEGRSVTVRTGLRVTDAEDATITVTMEDGSAEEIGYEQLIWTGGIRGPDAVSGARLPVRGDLRVDDRTFALGDAAAVTDVDGASVPASAQTAVRQARVAAENVSRTIESLRRDDHADGFGPRLTRYRYESPGWLVSVGDDAVAQVGPAVLTGRAARAVKATVGVGYLSSIGAVGEALDFAIDEFRPGRSR